MPPSACKGWGAQPGPDHHRVRARLTTGHAQGEHLIGRVPCRGRRHLPPRLGTVGTELLPGQDGGKTTEAREQGTALHEGA